MVGPDYQGPDVAFLAFRSKCKGKTMKICLLNFLFWLIPTLEKSCKKRIQLASLHPSQRIPVNFLPHVPYHTLYLYT